jgi:hypothetical protein
MTTPKPPSTIPAPAEPTENAGKTAKELQQEAPPPGQDEQPPTNPAGEPHLA